jgi:hypothetical protein
VLGWEPERVPQAHGKPVEAKSVKDKPVQDAEEPRPERRPKSKAARWLHETLAARPREAEQVRKLAARRGIKGRELKKARASERIVEVRDESTGRVTWSLPGQGLAGQGTSEAAHAAGPQRADVRGGSNGRLAGTPTEEDVPGQGAGHATGFGAGRASAVVEAAACS